MSLWSSFRIDFVGGTDKHIGVGQESGRKGSVQLTHSRGRCRISSRLRAQTEDRGTACKGDVSFL